MSRSRHSGGDAGTDGLDGSFRLLQRLHVGLLVAVFAGGIVTLSATAELWTATGRWYEGELVPPLAQRVAPESGGTVVRVVVANGALVQEGDTLLVIRRPADADGIAIAGEHLRSARRCLAELAGLLKSAIRGDEAPVAERSGADPSDLVSLAETELWLANHALAVPGDRQVEVAIRAGRSGRAYLRKDHTLPGTRFHAGEELTAVVDESPWNARARVGTLLLDAAVPGDRVRVRAKKPSGALEEFLAVVTYTAPAEEADSDRAAPNLVVQLDDEGTSRLLRKSPAPYGLECTLRLEPERRGLGHWCTRLFAGPVSVIGEGRPASGTGRRTS